MAARAASRVALLGVVGAIVLAGALTPQRVSAGPTLVYGQPQTLLGPAINSLKSVGGVAADDDGDVFATQDAPSRVVEVPTGSNTATPLPFSGLSNPLGIALDTSGDLFVVDSDHDRVLELAAGSTTQTVLPFSGLQLPVGVAVDPSGDVFVADSDNNRVVELAHGATSQTVLPFTGLSNPWSVAVHDGDVYVADTGNNRVLELAKGSSTQSVVPVGPVNQPHGVALDAAGDLFVAANEITELPNGASAPITLPFVLSDPVNLAVDSAGDVFIADGGILELAHGASAATALPAWAVSIPESVAVDPQGDALVVDTSGEGSRVLELDHGASTPQVLYISPLADSPVAVQADGDSWSNVLLANVASDEVAELAKGATEPSVLSAFDGTTPGGVAVDAAGDVFADDLHSGQVLELVNGATTPTALPFPKLDFPGGIAVDASGDVFVADTFDNRVYELASGQPTPTELPFAGLNSPSDVAVDAAGDVFVANGGANDILELAAGASTSTRLPFSGLSDPSTVALDAAGDLFITDANNGRLLESSLIPGTAPTLTADQPTADALVGQHYAYTFTADGYPAPTFSIASGAFPPGVDINPASGVIGGTPRATGTFTFTVAATNAVSSVETGELSITVSNPTAPVFTADQPTAQILQGQSYSYQFAATGDPAPTFVRGGQLPLGLTLDSVTGELSGTATATGTYDFTVTANNAASSTNSGPLSIIVARAPAFIADQPPSPAHVGTAYTYTFTASGYPSPVFSIYGGHLPRGLSLNSSTGEISGAPTAGGEYRFTIAVTNDVAGVHTDPLTIAVDHAPHFTRDHPPSEAKVGRAYRYRFHATGFPAPTYRIAAGHLPKGLHLNRTTGGVSGRPTKAGTFTFAVAATNSTSPRALRRHLTIVVRRG